MSRRCQRVIAVVLAACGGSEPASQTPAPVISNEAPAPDATRGDDLPPAAEYELGVLPPECVNYRSAWRQFDACEPSADARQDARDMYDAVSRTWGHVPTLTQEELQRAAMICDEMHQRLRRAAVESGCGR